MERVWKGIGIGDEGRRGEWYKGFVFVETKGCDCGGKDRAWGRKWLRVKRKRCCVRRGKCVCGVESNKKDSKTRCLLALKSLIY